MHDESQVAGVIINDDAGDEVAGVIVHDAGGDDELAYAQLDLVVGAEPPPETPG